MLSREEKMYKSQKSPYNYERMDSHAERAFAKALDEDPDILYWTKKHHIEIPYRSAETKLKLRDYLPDFWAKKKDGSFHLYEVKGRHLAKQKDTREKEIAAQLWCKARGVKYYMIYDNEVSKVPA